MNLGAVWGFGSSGSAYCFAAGYCFFTMDSPRSIFCRIQDLKQLCSSFSSTFSSTFSSAFSSMGFFFRGTPIMKSLCRPKLLLVFSALSRCALSNSFLARFSLSSWTMSSLVRESQPDGKMSWLLSWLPTVTVSQWRFLSSSLLSLKPGMRMGLFLLSSFSTSSRSISSSCRCCRSYSSLAAAAASFFSGLTYSFEIIFSLCCFHFSMPLPALLSMSSSFYSCAGLSASGRLPFFAPAFQQSAIELCATLPLSSSTPFFPIQTIIKLSLCTASYRKKHADDI